MLRLLEPHNTNFTQNSGNLDSHLT